MEVVDLLLMLPYELGIRLRQISLISFVTMFVFFSTKLSLKIKRISNYPWKSIIQILKQLKINVQHYRKHHQRSDEWWIHYSVEIHVPLVWPVLDYLSSLKTDFEQTLLWFGIASCLCRPELWKYLCLYFHINLKIYGQCKVNSKYWGGPKIYDYWNFWRSLKIVYFIVPAWYPIVCHNGRFYKHHISERPTLFHLLTKFLCAINLQFSIEH